MIASKQRTRDVCLDIDDDSSGIGRRGVIKMPLYSTEEDKYMAAAMEICHCHDAQSCVICNGCFP